jgi:putative oxidoreductase
MSCCTGKSLVAKWEKIVVASQDIFLLAIRLFWGWGFIQTGLGKFRNFDKTVEFFTSLNIPAPSLNVAMASGTELLGGTCLLLGLGSRVMTIPLLFTMVIAYSTAHRDELLNVFSDPDSFMQATPFLFAYATLIVLLFGAGKFSADRLIKGKASCCSK